MSLVRFCLLSFVLRTHFPLHCRAYLRRVGPELSQFSGAGCPSEEIGIGVCELPTSNSLLSILGSEDVQSSKLDALHGWEEREREMCLDGLMAR